MQHLIKVLDDLNTWQTETGMPLPEEAGVIAAAECMGDCIELRHGLVVGHEAPDGDVLLLANARIHNQQAWLADMEAACNGSVSIQWAVRPEVYFAQQEAQ